MKKAYSKLYKVFNFLKNNKSLLASALLAILIIGFWQKPAPASADWTDGYPPVYATFTNTGLKRNNVFYVGDQIAFNTSVPITSYEIRDYYGRLIQSGAPTGGNSNTIVVTNAGSPGWYKLNVYGSVNQGEPWGTSLGATTFVIFNNDSNFPAMENNFPPSPFASDEMVRAVTGMGPQRHVARVDSATAVTNSLNDLKSDAYLGVDKRLYLPYDPARKRAILIAFPEGTMNKDTGADYSANVTSLVSSIRSFLGTDALIYYEPRNEPNFTYSNGSQFVNEMRLFYQAVKAGDPTAKVIGPGVVTIGEGPAGLGWMDSFFGAGGGQYVDGISFHAYNNLNGDIFLARTALDSLKTHLTAYGLQNKELWQTEQGYASNSNGLYQPRLQGRWTMEQMMLYEQYGIPKEHNHIWYDREHGFWDVPMFWENDDGSLNPAAPLMRVWSEELFGTTYSSKYNFGTNGDKLYIGDYFSGGGKSVAAFMTIGSTVGKINLNVSGGSSITTVSPFGVKTSLPVISGKVELPLSELPTYVEIAQGQTISVDPMNWGTNLALNKPVTSSGPVSDFGSDPYNSGIYNPISKVNNGVFENWYGTQNNYGYLWADNTIGFWQDHNTDAWVTINLGATTTVDHVVAYAGSPWQLDGTFVDYELQYDNGGTWTTIEHVVEPEKVYKTASPVFRTRGDSYFGDRWIFEHSFSPVNTSRIRLLFHKVTAGGVPNYEAKSYGGQAGGTIITIKEIEVYNSGVQQVSLPTVTLSGPSNGASFLAPATVNFTANASGGSAPLKVEFYMDGTKVGEDTTPVSGEYSYSLANVPVGNHTSYAKVTDSLNKTANSPTANFSVNTFIEHGLKGEYFDNPPTLTSLKMTRTDPTIAFWFNGTSPITNKWQELFGMRWTGQVDALVAGQYTFENYDDHGMKVWIDNSLILNHWCDSTYMQRDSVNVTLSKGRHDIKVEYCENDGGASWVYLYWTPPGGTKSEIPTEQLYPPTTVAVTYPVSVTKTGLGSGKVSGSGLDCGAVCSINVSSSTLINLSVVPSSGSKFMGWSGACTGLTTCSFSVSGNASISAQFDLLAVPDTIPPTAPTGLSNAPSLLFSTSTNLFWNISTDNVGVAGYYVYRSNIRIATTTSNAYSDTTNLPQGIYTYTVSAFDAAGNESGRSNEYNFTLNPPSYTLTILKSGSGSGKSVGKGINCGSVCSASVPAGVRMIIFNVANSGSTYVGMTGNGVDCKPGLACSIILTGNLTLTAKFDNATEDTIPPSVPSGISGTVVSDSVINLTWSPSTDNINVTGYRVYKNGQQYGGVPRNSLTDTDLTPGTTYKYALTAMDASENESAKSAEYTITIPRQNKSTATYIKTDETTKGSWKGAYGSEAAYIIGDENNLSNNINISAENNLPWTWSASGTDIRYLQKINADDRLAACWYTFGNFTIDVNIKDSNIHKMALYFMDSDKNGRSETVDMIDADSGTILDTKNVSDFGEGKYLVWNVNGHIKVKITHTSGGVNAVLNGIFFDPTAVSSKNTPINTASVYGIFNSLSNYFIQKKPTTDNFSTQKIAIIQGTIPAQKGNTILKNDLREGMEGGEVMILQKLLKVPNANGYFGPATKAAVVKFQLDNKIASPNNTDLGVVGPRTRAVLNK